MIELLAVLFPILLVDVLNPTLFAVLVFAAGSSRPIANSVAMLLGHTLAYFAAGVLISYGLDAIANRLANPQQIDFAVGAVVGALLVWSFWSMRRNEQGEVDEPTWELTPAKCLGFGVIVNFIGIPFALPYFAAVQTIASSDLSLMGALLVLVIYNLGYASVFAVVPLLAAIMGERGKPVLERINELLLKASDAVLPWLILVLGLYLLLDAGLYFAAGEPVFI